MKKMGATTTDFEAMIRTIPTAINAVHVSLSMACSDAEGRGKSTCGEKHLEELPLDKAQSVLTKEHATCSFLTVLCTPKFSFQGGLISRMSQRKWKKKTPGSGTGLETSQFGLNPFLASLDGWPSARDHP